MQALGLSPCMDYKFAALLGAAYRGGSLVMHGDVLLSIAGNRVTEVRLLCFRHVCVFPAAARFGKTRGVRVHQP